jgi:hypothetical protein
VVESSIVEHARGLPSALTPTLGQIPPTRPVTRGATPLVSRPGSVLGSSDALCESTERLLRDRRFEFHQSGVRRGARGKLAGVAAEPLWFIDVGAGVDDAGHGEEEVREAVDVAEQGAGDRFDVGEGDDAALGAAADGAGEVELGGGGVTAGEDEELERRQLFIEGVDPAFEGCDIVIGDAGADVLAALKALFDVGGGEFAAEIEEVGLDDGEPASEVVVFEDGGGDAEERVEFIDGAVGLDADVVFGDARSTEEAGLSFVAGAGVDL